MSERTISEQRPLLGGWRIVALMAAAVVVLSGCGMASGETVTTPTSTSVQVDVEDGSGWDDYVGQMADRAMQEEREQRAREACDAGIIEAC